MHLVTVRICGVEVTGSGAEIQDRVLEKTAKLPAKTKRLMDTFGLIPQGVVDLSQDLITLPGKNGEMPVVGPLSPPEIGNTSRGIEAAVNEVLDRYKAAHLANTPIAKQDFDSAVLDFNQLAWGISLVNGAIVFFAGEHEWIFPAADPKLLRVQRPDPAIDQMIKSQLVRGCEVVEKLELKMFSDADKLVSVIIKVTGAVPCFKAKIALSQALGDWSLVLLTVRVTGKKGGVPQLRGEMSVERVPREQLTGS